MEALSMRLKWLREKQRLSQRQIAESLGLSLVGYQHIEYNKNNPKIETLIKLAENFNVSTDFLLGLTDRNSETEELVENYNRNIVEIERMNAELKNVTHQIFNIKKSVHRMPRDGDGSLFARENALQDLEERKVEIEKSIFMQHAFLCNSLIRLIQYCHQLPFGTPRKDPIISKYRPYEFFIDKAHDMDQYFLTIYCDELGQVGIFKVFESLEDANAEKFILNIALNSDPDENAKFDSIRFKLDKE